MKASGLRNLFYLVEGDLERDCPVRSLPIALLFSALLLPIADAERLGESSCWESHRFDLTSS